MKLIVVLIAGWSGNSAHQNFALLKKALKTLGVQVVIPEYINVKGSFVRFRTRKSIEEYADIVERQLIDIKKQHPNTPIIALGHSMGGLILKILCRRGYKFEEAIFAGTPNKGFSKKFLVMAPLAAVFRVKCFFEMLPGSKFLRELGPLPEGVYIGGWNDKVVRMSSAAPEEATRRIEVSCGHNMFPQEVEKVESSAIPVVVDIIGEYMQKHYPSFLYKKER